MAPLGNSSSNRPPSPKPPSIIQCFSERLYNIPESNLKYHPVQASGKTTAATPPPPVMMDSPIKHFQDKAQEFLNNPRLRQKIGTAPIYAMNPEVPHENEAGIVYSTCLWITGPLNQLLHFAFPERYKMKHEHNDAANQDIDENNQSVLRYDICFTEPDGKENKIAVIELKRPGSLRYNDFERAIVRHNDHTGCKDKIGQLHQMRQDSFLHANGKYYTKQVKAYAMRSKCPHVALFNWKHFIPFNFSPVTVGTDTTTTVADVPAVSWVQEDDTGPFFTHNAIIREVMLGWLLQAFEDAGIFPNFD